ncbi:zinc finger BED domain-containing protein RICESLEEPER 2-like protein, partial [Tanacetum coccineum]
MATTQVPIVLDDSTFNPSMNQDDPVIGVEDASSSEPKLAHAIVNGKYDHIRMRESIAHWILMHEYSFSIVEDAGFDFMMKVGIPQWPGLSRITAKNYCVREWDIENKIYSISMDNASSNDKAIKNLRRIFEEYMKLLCDGRLFHVRCCAHCKTRWNSTYEMLVGAYKLKEVFPKYEERDPDFDSCPLKDDWERVEQICEILEVKQVLDGKKDDESEFIRKMVEKMKEKFDKYWAEVHLLMAIAVVLDPRVKMWSLEFIFPKIYNSVDAK